MKSRLRGALWVFALTMKDPEEPSVDVSDVSARIRLVAVSAGLKSQQMVDASTYPLEFCSVAFVGGP